MSVVKKHINTLKWIDSQLEEVAQQSIEANIDVIEHMIVDEQLHQGLRANGKVAGWYAPTTEEYAKDPYNKPRMPKQTGSRFNFDWSGSFIDGIYVKIEEYGFDILTRDGKQRLLEEEYGKLLKLTKENNYKINQEIVIPAIYKFIFNNLFK